VDFVYGFDEQAPGGRELLGGKGVGLAEMTALGAPVPAGFTVTTDACREVMRTGEVPDGLWGEIDEHVARLEQRAGKRFGDHDDPLLVSVRSGAAISMPGMMDTILNLGLNDVAVEGLAAATGNPRFAYDSYRRLIQMYGEVVDGVDGHLFEGELQELKERRGVRQDVELTADDLRSLIATFQELYEREVGAPFPPDPGEQLRRAVRAVFDSWESPRAKVYRRTYDIPDELGTAVNVAAVEEQALAAHPSVSEVAVVAAPDERWGEVPVAFVTAAGDAPEEAELQEFARGRLARFKVPKRIEVVDELPKTGTGKIQKFVLRERLG